VTRDGTRLAAVIVAAILAVALSACGSSGTSSTSTSGEAGSQEGVKGQSGTEQGKKPGAAQKKAKSEKEGGNESAKRHVAKHVVTPLKVSGGGSQQFHVKGGDNSIQEYGEEKSETELREAAEAVHRFFVARAEARWADACSYLSKSLLQQLEQFAAKSEKKDCAAILNALTANVAPSVWREITTVNAASLRQEGEQAFLIYRGAPDHTVYAMPMKYEGGKWTVGALSGDALPGAA